MANQLNYHRNNGHRSYYPSLPSISSDPGQVYQISRDMGPPSLEFPPRPMEIDLNSSRTLPSPSTSALAAWDTTMLQSQGFGEVSYGSSNVAKMAAIDSQVRGPQDPITQWYTGNDGPWVHHKAIPEVPVDRLPPKHMGSHNPMAYGNQYRQPNPSEGGSIHYGVPHSDSGYSTQRSVRNASVFSADLPERDQDCQSLASHFADHQPFQQISEVIQQRDARMHDSCYSSSNSSDLPSLFCNACGKLVKTQSELKKHNLRHTKPFVCKVRGCTRTEGFSTTNDLDRHTRSIHPLATLDSTPTKKFRCHVLGCKSKDKLWPRLDNFRSHLKRVHSCQLSNEDQMDDMIQRAEFWEMPCLNMDQDLPSQMPLIPERSRTRSLPDECLSRQRRAQPDWKPLHLEVNEPTQDLEVSRPNMVENKTAQCSSGRSPLPEVPQRETVQPGEIFQPPLVRISVPLAVPETRLALNSVLLSPVGNSETSSTKVSHVTHATPLKTSSQNNGKATTRQTVASAAVAAAADATITEVIKSVLAGSGPNSPGESTSTVKGDLDRSNNLPVEKASPAWSNDAASTSALATSPTGNSSTNPAASKDSPSFTLEDESKDHIESKVKEVIRLLHERGYTFQKDPSVVPSTSPKIQNAGSSAGNKSENQVTCPTCKKFKGRPCELKKHMKRHERPYGCTFLTCNKTFGSKNDWKRHENSQHFHLETWRCSLSLIPECSSTCEPSSAAPDPETPRCTKVCYRRQTFQDHLIKSHGITSPEVLKEKTDQCRIGRNCQSRFWCGFCDRTVELKKQGLDAWTERFDHIDDHFMGRHDFKKQSILDWTPLDGDKSKNSPEGLDHESPSGSGSGCGSETAAPTAGSVPGVKRRRESSDGNESEQPTKTSRRGEKRDFVVFCCQCDMPHNPKFETGCTNCADSHSFCASCPRRRKEEIGI